MREYQCEYCKVRWITKPRNLRLDFAECIAAPLKSNGWHKWKKVS